MPVEMAAWLFSASPYTIGRLEDVLPLIKCPDGIDIVDWKQIQRGHHVGQGSFAVIQQATWHHDGKEEKVCLKLLLNPRDPFHRLTFEEEALRYAGEALVA